MLPDATPVAGYVVNRYDAATGALETVAGAGASVVAMTSCLATSSPAGTWVFTVTPLQLSTTGGGSPDSAPVIVRLG